MNILNPVTISEVELWKARRLCKELFNTDLVPSDSHDDETGAVMTSDQAWYFVPCPDDPVMTGRGINRNSIPTDKPRWCVETVHVASGYPFEPDEYELGEDGDRQNSLFDAVAEASRIAHNHKINNLAEGIFWEGEKFKDQIDPPSRVLASY